MFYNAFLQYLFHEQWEENKKYINDQGIEVIGDIPIYVSPDSADVWANRDIFEIEGTEFPNVAGVPPDFACADGQLWGNPLYNWDNLKETDYKWWMDRIKHNLSLYDVLRIDHFRALANYFAIPGDAETAKVGTWRKGPGMDFFKEVYKHFDKDSFIAEDLGGEENPQVVELLKETELPGMRLVEIALGSDDIIESHLPENLKSNHIGYIGTHDNNTLLGWLENLDEDVRKRNLEMVGLDPEIDLSIPENQEEVVRAFLENLWSSDAILTVMQLQDALTLGEEARMNTPGTIVDNWEWKVPEKALEKLDTKWLKELNEKYGRSTEPEEA